MGKKILIAFISLMLLFTIFYALVSTGVIKLKTVGSDNETKKEAITVENLEDGCYYVWHNPNSNIEADLNGTVGRDVFRICPEGTVNWNDNKNIAHTIWFTSSNDYEIPTLYPGDELIYISKTTAPSDGIKWERYADYGYTIGVANLEGATSGHFRILLDVDKGYAGYLNFESDAAALSNYTRVSELYLDKIGNVPVRDNLVSEGGTVIGLEKDGKYLCEWYTGTYYQDYEMVANNHTFCIMEEFTTYEYEFLHSKAISITIPEWFKSGYYYVGGVGLFRYVNMNDLSLYNGLAYDTNVNWNDPIILYDDRGLVIYDPSSGIDKRNEQSSQDYLNNKQTSTKQSYAAEDVILNSSDYNMDVPVDETLVDEGAEQYEDFYEEQYIE